MEDKYDSALLGILQNEGKIEKFLDVLLGFLYRRTDFYRIMKDKKDKLGFPPGVALKMLTSIFKHYDDMTRRDDGLREAKKLESEQREKATPEPTKTATQSAGTGETKSTGTNQAASKTDPVESKQTSKVLDSGEQKMEEDFQEQDRGDKSADSDKTVSGNKSVVSAPTDGKKTDSSASVRANTESAENKDDKAEDDDEDSELTRQQKLFQANPDSYNGAVRENYSWAQSITDLDLKVKVPAYIRKGKDCQVEIAKRHVKVAYRDQGGQWQTVVDGDLTWDVDKEESMWSLIPGQTVHINFEKKEERWWEAVLTDEPKINVRKIDASRPMTDLDEEAQAKIEEMMYNDRQKKMGLPQSHEQKMYDTLKTAWNAEGSPFKGQPFDPSKLNVDPSGVINFKS